MREQSPQYTATWGQALAIWWWITWRSLLVSFFGGAIVGFIFGWIAGLVGLDLGLVSTIGSVIGSLIGLLVTIYFFKDVIGKKFGEYRLILSPLHDE